MLNDIREQIDSHKIISFDIFDTMLLRPYIRPIDLFFHLEKNENLKGFAQARVTAEQKSREIHNDIEDITIDEIYNEIDDEYKHLKTKEMSWERQVLQPNPEIKEIYDYALKKQKQVIVISDMYLPEKFLLSVLKEKGFKKFEKVYVSCEYRKSKHTGSLYKFVLNDLNISAKDILHIGDNAYSDNIQAIKENISAVLYTKVVDKLFARQPALRYYYENNPTLGKSIILGMMSLNFEKTDYWYSLGWNYGAPAVVAYVQWLDEQIKSDKIKHLLFIARDGYILQQIFNLLSSTDCKTDYLFAPRFVNLQDKNLYAQYTTYLQTFDLPKENIAMVDSITINFSSQKLLKNFFPNILGYYWLIRNLNQTVSEFPLTKEFRKEQSEYMKEWGLMEFFMTAPYPPAASFSKGKVVLTKATDCEQRRIAAYKSVEKAIIDYTHILLAIFDRKKLFITEKDICELIDILPMYPTKEDEKFLSSLCHASDNYNKKYDPLMTYWLEHTVGKVKILGIPLIKIVRIGNNFKLKLFSLLPILTYMKNYNKIKISLCGIPLLWIKKEIHFRHSSSFQQYEMKNCEEFTNSKTYIRLFGFIPLLKCKKTQKYNVLYLFNFLPLLKYKFD